LSLEQGYAVGNAAYNHLSASALPPVLQRLSAALRRLQSEAFTLYFAARDGRAPWFAKLYAALIVAYAFSPIDLIPDFIPVLGYLDEVILLPPAIWVGLQLMPDPVLVDARARAKAQMEKPRSPAGALMIVAIWIACTVGIGVYVYRRWGT
jgi:uncharacterized membrane protein YkvA (DUF1232 family)